MLGEYMNKQANENNQQVTVGFAQYDALRTSCEVRVDALTEDFLSRMEDLRKEMQSDKEKAIKRWQKALICVSITLTVFLAGIFGSIFYVLTTYEFTTETYSYEQYNDGLNNLNTGEQGDVLYEPMVEDNESNSNENE